MSITRRTDFQGITDMYLDTAAYNLDPSFNYYLQDPKELDQRRLRAYKYYMDFYDGKHWDDTVGSVTMSEWNPAYGYYYSWNEDFNRRTWNISRNIIDKLVDWLCQDEWKNKLAPELNDTDCLETLENVWIANRRHEFTYDLSYQACITGDAFVKVAYDPDFYADGVGEIVLQVLDSRTVIPYFDGHDKRKLVGCRIQYPTHEVQEDGDLRTVMYQEVHTEGTIVELIDGEIDKTYPNPLGELMVVHVPNEPLPYRKFGRSDLENLLLANKEYNEKASDFSEILAYHAAPVTIIKGARVQSLERGARKVWAGIPKDGDVYNLSLEADLSSSIEYLEMLKKHMHESGNVPEEALGALQEVSNTSAAALHVQYQPLLERIWKKQIHIGKGLRKINELILKFYEAAGALELPDDIPPAQKFRTEIEWGDALPRDRSIDLADISTEIGLGIESKEGALKRLGVEDPEEKLKEIEEEMKHDAELQFQTAGMMGDQMGAASGSEGPQQDVSGAVDAAKTNSTTHGSNVAQEAVKKSAQTTSAQSASQKQAFNSRTSVHKD